MLLIGQAAALGQTTTPVVPVEAGRTASGPLAEYVAKPDAEYGWTVRRRGTHGTGKFAELLLTSQRWRGGLWKHQLFVYKPAVVRDASRALLFVGGGVWHDKLNELDATDEHLPPSGAMFAALADQLQTPIAVLLQVPFQPIFDEKLHEDAAIAYTFDAYLRTGDATWPLLLPMVKSAVRAMDCLGEFAMQEWQLAPTKFTLTGASKRGWTTWLTAAVDARVVALAPMVIDMLNLPRHIPLQLTSWGKLSEQIHDYTERGIHAQLASPTGRNLLAIVDPLHYLPQIRQPKWVLLGTNDRYWPLESLNLYWQDITGPKYVTYVPNNGHGLRDPARVVGVVAALHRAAAGELTLPNLSWQFEESDDALDLIVQSDRPVCEFNAWTATAATRDLRDSLWQAKPVSAADDVYRFRLPKPTQGYTALIGEAKFDDPRTPFYLSTNVRIVGPKTAKP
jgi:PhoPQ-activated pathogenicity-related protein